MSEMLRRSALAAVALLVTAVGRSAAQDQRELARRVETAWALSKAAAAEAERLHLADTRTRNYTDTLTILSGSVRLITTPRMLSIVRLAAARTDSVLRDRVQPVLDQLRGAAFTIREDTAWKQVDGFDHAFIAYVDSAKGEETGGTHTRETAPTVSATLVDKILQATVRRGSKVFQAWASGPYPLDTASTDDWAAVRMELVSSQSTVGPRCYGGDVSACAAYLGLRETADPVIALYDSIGRRAFVSNARWDARRINLLATDLCINRGSDSACIVVMRGFGERRVSRLGSWRIRKTVIQQAALSGGPQAFGRLIQNSVTIGDAVAAASGVPLDSVLTVWHRRVREEGIASESFTPAIALLSIGWVLVLGAVATRSGRWR
jgi:hypothetical protein